MPKRNGFAKSYSWGSRGTSEELIVGSTRFGAEITSEESTDDDADDMKTVDFSICFEPHYACDASELPKILRAAVPVDALDDFAELIRRTIESARRDGTIPTVPTPRPVTAATTSHTTRGRR